MAKLFGIEGIESSNDTGVDLDISNIATSGAINLLTDSNTEGWQVDEGGNFLNLRGSVGNTVIGFTTDGSSTDQALSLYASSPEDISVLKSAIVQVFSSQSTGNCDIYAASAGSSQRIRFLLGAGTPDWSMENSNIFRFHSSFSKIAAADSDDKGIALCGGTDSTVSDGSFIACYGNSTTSSGTRGLLALIAGNTGTSTGKIRFDTAGVARWNVSSDGNLIPEASGIYNIGDVDNFIDTLYVNTVIGWNPSDEVFPLNNNEFASWRNSGDTQTLNAITVDSSNDLLLGSTDVSNNTQNLHLSVDGSTAWSVPTTGDLNFYEEDVNIKSASNTNASIALCGGTARSSANGSYIECYGVDDGTYGGYIRLIAGGSSPIRFLTFGQERWEVAGIGHFVPMSSGTFNVGSSSSTVANIYSESVLDCQNIKAPSSSDLVIVGRSGNDGITSICGGNNRTTSVGGYINCYGNSASSNAGKVIAFAGSSSPLEFWTGGSKRWQVDDSGNLEPNGSTLNIGDSSNIVNNAYVDSVLETTLVRAPSDGDLLISTNVSAGTDNRTVRILPAGTTADYARGAFIEVFGQKVSGANGNLRLGASSQIQLYTGSITGSNKLSWQIDESGRLSNFNNNEEAEDIFRLRNSNLSYTNAVERMTLDRGPSSAFEFLVTETLNGGLDIQHNLRGDGQAYCDGSWNGGGADYAEYMELTVSGAAELGDTVVLEGDKVRAYNSQTDSIGDIIGVVRPNEASSVVGNLPLQWPGKYEKDQYGRYILDENDNRIVSEDYNPEQAPYILRSERKEWVVVGLLGQVVIKSNTEKPLSWRKMKDINQDLELWFIK